MRCLQSIDIPKWMRKSSPRMGRAILAEINEKIYETLLRFIFRVDDPYVAIGVPLAAISVGESEAGEAWCVAGHNDTWLPVSMRQGWLET